jgi:mRNA-degrading endonuclease RelE of RelBE toxin-antitoxin system
MLPKKFEVRLFSGAIKAAKFLARKYPSFADDLVNLEESLSENPIQGTALGNDCYKLRIAISSKGRGKSGGARVISVVVYKKQRVHILAIYDKGERDSISRNELLALLTAAKGELE